MYLRLHSTFRVSDEPFWWMLERLILMVATSQ